MPARRSGPVERAVRRDLRRLDDEARTGSVAQAIILLAQRLDGWDTCGECEVEHPVLSARDEAVIVRELRLSLRSLTPGGGGEVDAYEAIIAGLSAPVGDPA